MRPHKIIGILLFFAATLAFLFSLLGIFEVWQFQPLVIKNGDDSLVWVIQTLTTTQDGLNVVDKALQTTRTDVVALDTATQALAQAIHDSNAMIGALADMTDKDLPQAVSATQTSLASAQGSAKLIDDILGTLTGLPFLNLAPYKPDVPLHTSLDNVSISLETIPSSLQTIHSSLLSNQTNLGTIETELNQISTSIKGISENLDNAQQVVKQYQTLAGQLKTRCEDARQAAPTWITGAAWFLTFILGWFLIVQLGFFIQAFDLLRK